MERLGSAYRPHARHGRQQLAPAQSGAKRRHAKFRCAAYLWVGLFCLWVSSGCRLANSPVAGYLLGKAPRIQIVARTLSHHGELFLTQPASFTEADDEPAELCWSEAVIIVTSPHPYGAKDQALIEVSLAPIACGRACCQKTLVELRDEARARRQQRRSTFSGRVGRSAFAERACDDVIGVATVPAADVQAWVEACRQRGFFSTETFLPGGGHSTVEIRLDGRWQRQAWPHDPALTAWLNQATEASDERIAQHLAQIPQKAASGATSWGEWLAGGRRTPTAKGSPATAPAPADATGSVVQYTAHQRSVPANSHAGYR